MKKICNDYVEKKHHVEFAHHEAWVRVPCPAASATWHGSVKTEIPIMKKLMMLALVAVTAMVSVGCQRPWFSRGASGNTCPNAVPDCHTGAGPVIQQGYQGENAYLPGPAPQG
jgi:hypothetical protein